MAGDPSSRRSASRAAVMSTSRGSPYCPTATSPRSSAAAPASSRRHGRATPTSYLRRWPPSPVATDDLTLEVKTQLLLPLLLQVHLAANLLDKNNLVKYDTKTGYFQDAYHLQLKMFFDEVKHQQFLRVVRSFLELFSVITIGKLAQNMGLNETTLRTILMAYAHKTHAVDNDGNIISTAAFDFYIDEIQYMGTAIEGLLAAAMNVQTGEESRCLPPRPWSSRPRFSLAYGSSSCCWPVLLSTDGQNVTGLSAAGRTWRRWYLVRVGIVASLAGTTD